MKKNNYKIKFSCLGIFFISFFTFSDVSHAADIEAAASRTSGVAPLSVHFNADLTASSETERSFHDLEYSWNFGDPTAGNWGTNNKLKNEDKGPVAAHVYETPGTFTTTLTVRDADGVVDTKTFEVVVSDPDVVYAGTLTTCVNNIGDNLFTGCPIGANQINNNDPTSSTVINAAGDGERLLFKRGYVASLSSVPAWPKSDGPVTIGAYGTCNTPNSQGICSNAPVFNTTLGFITIDYMQDLRVIDIRTIGSFSYGGINDMQKILFLRIDVEDALGGNAIGWGHFNDSTPMTIDEMGIIDCRVIDSAQYGLYVGGERMALMGNIFSDSGTTHLVRSWQAYKSVISHNTFDSSTTEGDGQRPLLKFTGPDDIFQDPEHCTPVASTGCLENYTEMSVISDNVFGAAGAIPITIAPQSAAADTQLSDIIFERNKILRDWGMYYPSSNMNGGILVVGNYINVRNNIIDFSHAQEDSDGIYIDKYPGGSIGCMIYNNTIYRSDSANDYNYGIYIDSGVVNTSVRNNYVSFPLVTGPRAAVYDSGTGTFSSDNILTNTPYFIDPDNANPLLRNFSLTSNSTEAIDQGTIVPVFDDFTGQSRVGTYDIGAFAYESVDDTTPPTITSVSSNKTNGIYTTGEVIDIDVTFSELVSSGNVTVTLETGTVDRSCTFTVSGASTGTCNYIVQAGDTTSDLTVNTIAGTIADTATNAMVNFVPATNLAANKALVIDTTLPTITINNGTDTGPTSDDTINLTAVDTNLNTASLAYGFSVNNVCDASDTYSTSFTNSTDFHITTMHTDYLCARASDLAGSSRYQLVGQLNVSDTTPPVLSAGTPSGTLPAGTVATTLSLTTNENATCKYGTAASTAYGSITNTFTTTGGTSHSSTLTGLTNGNSYSYYVRCSDGDSNINTSDYTINFSVANATVSSGGGGGGGSSSKDTAPPRNTSILIHNGDAKTASSTVKLTLTARDEDRKLYMQISDSANYTGAPWKTFTTTSSWTFSQGNGLRTLYARFKDSKGNVSGTVIDSIVLEEANAPAYVAPQTQTTTKPTTQTSGHTFKLNMGMGAKGSEVVELQKRLRSAGFFTYPTNSGYYGQITTNAVTQYQRHRGISPTGYVGPLTRAELNKGSTGGEEISIKSFVQLLIALGVIPQEKAELALSYIETLP